MSEPFARAAQQRDADRLGMLIFLASEAMLFGGLFGAALALRLEHPRDVALASSHLKLWLGTANTAVLLTSSLLAALAVAFAREGRARAAGRSLAGAALLGTAFLAVKAAEYLGEYREGLIPHLARSHFDTPAQQLFMNLYFAATGLHALHVAVGIALLAVVALRPAALADRHAVLLGNAALYWHLVDIVWVFLYPTLYLPGAGVR